MPDVRPSLAESLSKSFNRVRARGPIEVWELVSSRVADNLWSDDALIVFSAEAGGTTAPSDGLRLVVATPDDAADFARDIGTDSASTFAARLSPTSHCYLVREGSKILHSSWVTLFAAWTRELRGYVMPPAGDAYVYESFTRPDARGRGVYPFALSGLRAELATGGVARVWVAAEADNAPSIRAIGKAGFEERYRLSYRRRFGTLQLTDEGAEAHGALVIARRLPAR